MAQTPRFDSNTWYSLKNTGTNFYLDCNVISICGAGTSALTNFEYFQISQPDSSSPFYIRPKAENVDENGEPFCINLSTGQPFLSLCNNASATWGTGFWNGQNSVDGLFFYSTQRGDSERLSLNDNGVWSLPDYSSISRSDLDQMRWSVASLAAINDQSYSTVPAVITASGSPNTTAISSSSITTTTVTSSNSTTTTGSNPFSFGSSTDSTSSSGSSVSSATSTTSTQESTSTTVVVLTPTTTANQSPTSSRTSSAPTTSITLASAAHKTEFNARVLITLAAMTLALQINQWLV